MLRRFDRWCSTLDTLIEADSGFALLLGLVLAVVLMAVGDWVAR